jgi:hypothetical protein
MIKKAINRRQFMQTSGAAAAGVAAVASGAVLIAPDGAWAMSLSTLDAHEAATLLVMSRQIFPHPDLGDMYYAKVVSDLDQKAKADAAVAAELKGGVAALDKAMGIAWSDLSWGNQLAVLTTMENTPFFQTVRGAALVSIYNNPLVWRHFGYEGASFPFGGYIHRGFDDLEWLPHPPEEASPAAG